jgi:hypothetical protein
MEKLEKGKKGCEGIDRKRESELVLEYQKTGDERVFMEIYAPRIPTFEYLAKQFSYICDDMKSEVQLVFMKSIIGFKPHGRMFNTYYYTSVLNHIRNLVKAKKRKKRTLENGEDPSDSFLYLDDSIDHDDGCTFHDIVCGRVDDALKYDVYDILNVISERSEILFDIAVGMMSTGKQPLKRKTYELTGTLHCEESMDKCLRRMTGIPRDCYKLIDMDVMEREVRCVLDVSRQKAFRELLNVVSDMDMSIVSMDVV